MNPYNPPTQAPVIEKSDATLPGPVSWVIRLAWCLPFLLIGFLYGTWGIASLVLGHPPTPSLDDPSEIGIVVDIAYYLTGAIFMAFPAVGLVGVLATLLSNDPSWIRRLTGSGALAVLYAATIVMLRWDPLRVLTWFMD